MDPCASLFKLAVAVALLAGLGGCASFEVGTKGRLRQPKDRSRVTAVFAVELYQPYEGEIVKAGLLGCAKNPGELASLDIWPISGVAVGVAGARVRIIPVEVGFGFLGYDPKPTPPTAEPEPASAPEG